MPVSITANTSARYAQASLTKQNAAITQGTLRMSSGQRVLSAADDAASMAIGSSLKIENAGVKSAILNATSGTSMLQIADGALGQISELLTRMKALATQASSGQYDDATRTLLDGEFQGLKNEIDRLAQATVFNDVKILAGQKDFDLAYGASANVGIAEIRFDQTLVTGDQSFRYDYDAETENFTLTRTDSVPATSQTINITALMNGTAGVGGNLVNNQTIVLGFSQLGVTMTLGSAFDRTADIGTGVAVTEGGVMTVASSSFVPAQRVMPAAAQATLTALGGAVYSPTTGALHLPTTSDATTTVLDGLPGISYAVNGGAPGASGAASPDLVSAGPTPVDVYADTANGKVLVGTVVLGDTTTVVPGSDTIEMTAFRPSSAGIPVATPADFAALGGTVFDAVSGNLTLPMTSDTATVVLDAIPGMSYAVNGAPAGASGAASSDLVGPAPVTVDIYMDAAGGGQTLLGRVTLGDVASTGNGAGSLQVNVANGMMFATDTGDIEATHLTYKVGTGVAAGVDTISVDVPAMTLQALGIENIEVTSQINADEAIDKLNDALIVLNQGRANVGAQQLRLEAVARNLSVISDNNEAAKSSLMDVDVSKEITEISTNQAMLQASVAMLQRANQLPDILLRLLQN